MLSEDNSCFIIAEAGVCHDGSLDKAKLLVDIAKDSGADAVKFQTWITEELIIPNTKKADYQKERTSSNESQFDMIKNLELTYKDFEKLKRYCEEKNILFLSTPDEEKSAKFLIEELNLPIIKIGSGELTNIGFLKYVASYQKKIIISTGMSNIEQITDIQKKISKINNNLIFLHCTSEYPTKYEDANLNSMLTIREKTGGIVGYSDHTLGIECSLVAVSLGAKIIEKHFTHDPLADGPDHKFALSSSQLKELVLEIRKLEKIQNKKEYVKNKIGTKFYDLIRGSYDKIPTKTELKNKKVLQKSIVSSFNLEKGDTLTKNNTSMKRADGKGIRPEEIKKILGKKTKKSIQKNKIIVMEDLE